MTARGAIAQLRREGWRERAGKGSHIRFTRDSRATVVSNHPSDIPPPTLRQICRQAKWEYPPER